jgi:hypothetical protein
MGDKFKGARCRHCRERKEMERRCKSIPRRWRGKSIEVWIDESQSESSKHLLNIMQHVSEGDAHIDWYKVRIHYLTI